jgi:hypothetical protein
VRGADVMELLGHDVFGKFGLVAFAAQVREIKLTQSGGHDLRDGLGGGDVGDVTVPAKDALLQRPRTARAILQHFHVVIGFEYEDVRGADAFQNQFRDVAKVSCKTDVARGSADQKTDGILRVVRDGKSFDVDVADFKAPAGLEQAPVDFGFEGIFVFEREGGFFAPFGFETPDGSILRAAIAKNGDVKFVRESKNAGDVVGMFVRDQDRRKIFRRAPDGSEARADLARRKSGVDEDAGIFGLDVGAIAAGTGAKNGEFDGHDRTLTAEKCAGNFFQGEINFPRAFDILPCQQVNSFWSISAFRGVIADG